MAKMLRTRFVVARYRCDTNALFGQRYGHGCSAQSLSAPPPPTASFRADLDGPIRFSGTRRVRSVERFDQIVVPRQRASGSEEEREPRIMLVDDVDLLAN